MHYVGLRLVIINFRIHNTYFQIIYLLYIRIFSQKEKEKRTYYKKRTIKLAHFYSIKKSTCI